MPNHTTMDFEWHRMTAEEHAEFDRILGIKVFDVNGIYWKRIRPFFYRPHLPFQVFQPKAVLHPRIAIIGGYQHAVPAGESANSFLNLLIFENPKDYSLQELDRHERREVRRAADSFRVLPISDTREFKEKAYPVYLSFYERTRYSFKADRRFPEHFSRWVDALFQNPKVIVLGAFKKDRELGAVGIWRLVEDTLVYSTFFCEAESLKMHVTGFMLHTMREAAASYGEIRQIFVGNYKYAAINGIDGFYLARGCKLVRKPAFLRLNPLARVLLKRLCPRQYRQLLGDLPAAPDEGNVEKDPPPSPLTVERNGSALRNGNAVGHVRSSKDTLRLT